MLEVDYFPFKFINGFFFFNELISQFGECVKSTPVGRDFFPFSFACVKQKGVTFDCNLLHICITFWS